jgi:hypothetical protein
MNDYQLILCVLAIVSFAAAFATYVLGVKKYLSEKTAKKAMVSLSVLGCGFLTFASVTTALVAGVQLSLLWTVFPEKQKAIQANRTRSITVFLVTAWLSICLFMYCHWFAPGSIMINITAMILACSVLSFEYLRKPNSSKASQ